MFLGLPAPGAMVDLSPAYRPMTLKGVTIHADNPFLFDFIVDAGQDRLKGEAAAQESTKLIKYFLAALAIQEKDQWVNLSPYEKERIIPRSLGQTDMGRDLLAQDYLLKQLTASLIYPGKGLGKAFWDKIYARAGANSAAVPVNTFNKVWIMADRAKIFERNNSAFVVETHLKVMLEEDYLAAQKNQRQPGDMFQQKIQRTCPQAGCLANNALNVKATQGTQTIRQLILPELEKEVNTGRQFAQLRQIFNAVILASWYKNTLKDALLTQAYAGKGGVAGIDIKDAGMKQAIYARYLQAYKKGVFNFVREDKDPATGAMVPRKYFSGGVVTAVHVDRASVAEFREALDEGIDPWLTVATDMVIAQPTGAADKQKAPAKEEAVSREQVRQWADAANDAVVVFPDGKKFSRTAVANAGVYLSIIQPVLGVRRFSLDMDAKALTAQGIDRDALWVVAQHIGRMNGWQSKIDGNRLLWTNVREGDHIVPFKQGGVGEMRYRPQLRALAESLWTRQEKIFDYLLHNTPVYDAQKWTLRLTINPGDLERRGIKGAETQIFNILSRLQELGKTMYGQPWGSTNGPGGWKMELNVGWDGQKAVRQYNAILTYLSRQQDVHVSASGVFVVPPGARSTREAALQFLSAVRPVFNPDLWRLTVDVQSAGIDVQTWQAVREDMRRLVIDGEQWSAAPESDSSVAWSVGWDEAHARDQYARRIRELLERERRRIEAAREKFPGMVLLDGDMYTIAQVRRVIDDFLSKSDTAPNYPAAQAAERRLAGRLTALKATGTSDRTFVEELGKMKAVVEEPAVGRISLPGGLGMAVLPADQASIAQAPAKEDYGGIDLQTANMQWDITRRGPAPQVTVSAADLERYRREGLSGLRPHILKITPLADPRSLFGVNSPSN